MEDRICETFNFSVIPCQLSYKNKINPGSICMKVAHRSMHKMISRAASKKLTARTTLQKGESISVDKPQALLLTNYSPPTTEALLVSAGVRRVR